MTKSPSTPPKNDTDDADTLDSDWAAAMSEQLGSTSSGDGQEANEAATEDPKAESPSEEQDPWASALAEQAEAAPDLFPPLIAQSDQTTPSDIDMIMDIPVQLSVELGRTRLSIKSILQLGQGSVVELDGLAGEPMDIYVNGYLIAQGEVVVVDDKYGIRVTDIITPTDRINRLNDRR